MLSGAPTSLLEKIQSVETGLQDIENPSLETTVSLYHAKENEDQKQKGYHNMTDCDGSINLASNEENNHANPLVIFTPSGRRGNIPQGTTVLDAARMLNVDLDSICGGQAKCGRCQISPVFGKFAKDNINSDQNNLSPPSASELAFAKRRGLKPGRRLGCNAQIFDLSLIHI